MEKQPRRLEYCEENLRVVEKQDWDGDNWRMEAKMKGRTPGKCKVGNKIDAC